MIGFTAMQNRALKELYNANYNVISVEKAHGAVEFTLSKDGHTIVVAMPDDEEYYSAVELLLNLTEKIYNLKEDYYKELSALRF